MRRLAVLTLIAMAATLCLAGCKPKDAAQAGDAAATFEANNAAKAKAGMEQAPYKKPGMNGAGAAKAPK